MQLKDMEYVKLVGNLEFTVCRGDEKQSKTQWGIKDGNIYKIPVIGSPAKVCRVPFHIKDVKPGDVFYMAGKSYTVRNNENGEISFYFSPTVSRRSFEGVDSVSRKVDSRNYIRYSIYNNQPFIKVSGLKASDLKPGDYCVRDKSSLTVNENRKVAEDVSKIFWTNGYNSDYKDDFMSASWGLEDLNIKKVLREDYLFDGYQESSCTTYATNTVNTVNTLNNTLEMKDLKKGDIIHLKDGFAHTVKSIVNKSYGSDIVSQKGLCFRFYKDFSNHVCNQYIISIRRGDKKWNIINGVAIEELENNWTATTTNVDVSSMSANVDNNTYTFIPEEFNETPINNQRNPKMKILLSFFKLPLQILACYVLWVNQEHIYDAYNYAKGVDVWGAVDTIKAFAQKPSTIFGMGVACAIGGKYMLRPQLSKTIKWLAGAKVNLDNKINKIAKG